jgi:flavorubredoxin
MKKIEPYRASEEVTALPSFHDLPGYGILTINGFVLHAAEPILIDTATRSRSDDFIAALEGVIDVGSLRWVWITHTDADHIGSLHRLLESVPELKVVTTYVGLAKMSTFAPLPVERVHLLNPGQQLHLGDRSITSFRPPLFDAPETTGFFDEKSRTLFSSDCFGGIIQEPVYNVSELSAEALVEGQLLWTAIDTPWVHKIDRNALAREIDEIRQLRPSMICSGHLPTARACDVARVLDTVLEAPAGRPFVGHDQEAMQALLSQAKR